MKTVIKNATVVSPADGLNGVCDILIEDGKIAAFGNDLTAENVIDAAGLTAVPGLVDMHVHLRDPGQTAKEDILTGCRPTVPKPCAAFSTRRRTPTRGCTSRRA